MTDKFLNQVVIRSDIVPGREQLVALYSSVGWRQALFPAELLRSVENSAAVFTAWLSKESVVPDKLIGLLRVISDGVFIAYVQDMLVKPEFQGKGVGQLLMQEFDRRFGHFHNQALIAEDEKARRFYLSCGLRWNPTPFRA